MPMRFGVEHRAQLGLVHGVAVVCHDNTIRAVDIKWLGLGMRKRSGRRVAHMSYAHRADQIRDIARVEHITDHTIALDLEKAAFRTARHDTCCILATVLKHTQTFVQLRSYVTLL